MLMLFHSKFGHTFRCLLLNKVFSDMDYRRRSTLCNSKKCISIDFCAFFCWLCWNGELFNTCILHNMKKHKQHPFSMKFCLAWINFAYSFSFHSLIVRSSNITQSKSFSVENPVAIHFDRLLHNFTRKLIKSSTL